MRIGYHNLVPSQYIVGNPCREQARERLLLFFWQRPDTLTREKKQRPEYLVVYWIDEVVVCCASFQDTTGGMKHVTIILLQYFQGVMISP